ncbi:phage minor head protein [Bacillota bacterium Lsc_1132]
MAGNTPPSNQQIDALVLARRQKDLEGYLARYQDLLDQRVTQYAAEISPAWQRISENIANEITAIYNELQDAQGVEIVKQPIDAAKYRNMQRQIERLGKLQQYIAEVLTAAEQQQSLENNLAYNYTDAYYFHAFGLEQAAKVAVQAPILSYAQVMGVIANPWLPDGNTYSDRLRANTAYLAQKMQKTVENAVGSGWSINRTAREIQNNAQEGYFNAVRLARTEINRAASQGASHLYMQNADILDSKRWNATLDSRTAPKDADNDSKVYPLDYDTPENPGRPGERIPNHPNCRCKYSPVLSALGISTKERIARGNGDSPTNFGERAYTKAKDYREYAKAQGLPDLDERLRNDNPRSYLRRGETLAAYKPAIGKPYQQPKPAPSSVKSDNVVTFTPAKTIKEANRWAADNIPQVKQIDYSGFDLPLANEVNQAVFTLFQDYPEIEDINFIGTTQQRNKKWHDWRIKLYAKELNEEKGGQFEGRGEMEIEKLIRKYNSVKKPKPVPGNSYAWACNSSWGEYSGISFNQKWAKDHETFKQAVARDVSLRWHPEGTEQPVSVLIHEFGHSIDYFLDKIGLRDKYITPITKDVLSLYSVEIEEQLSRYAGTNDREVVAEAFAEYRLNPTPRKWARKIGEAIEKALNEYRKGRK